MRLTKIKSDFGFRSIIQHNQVELYKRLSMMQVLKERYEAQSYELLQYRILKLKYRQLHARYIQLKSRYKKLFVTHQKDNHQANRRVSALMYGQLNHSHHHVKDNLAMLAHDVSRFRCVITHHICHPRDVSCISDYNLLPGHYAYLTKSALPKLTTLQRANLRLSQKTIIQVHPRAIMDQYQHFVDKLCRIQRVYVDQLWFNRKHDLFLFIEFIVNYCKELNDPKVDIYILKKLAHWGDPNAVAILKHYFLKGRFNKFYIGQHNHKVLQGYGCLRLGNQFKYIGNFFKGTLHGYGQLIFRDGRNYKGQFKQGKYDGHGTFYYVDGRKISGIFRSGKMTQNVAFLLPNGQQVNLAQFKNFRIKERAR